MDALSLAYVSLGAGLVSALVGGVFLSFSDFIMRGLLMGEPRGGAEAMQMINITVLKSIFLTSFLALAPGSVVLAGLAWFMIAGVAKWWLIWAALIYVTSVLFVTIGANVPMNKRLAVLTPGDPQTDTYWRFYGARWTGWNHVRTIGSIMTSACFMMGAVSIFTSSSL